MILGCRSCLGWIRATRAVSSCRRRKRRKSVSFMISCRWRLMIRTRQRNCWIGPLKNRRSSRGKLTPAILASVLLEEGLVLIMVFPLQRNRNRRRSSIWRKGWKLKNRGLCRTKSRQVHSNLGWNSSSRTFQLKLLRLSHIAISKHTLATSSFQQDRNPNPLAFRQTCSRAQIRAWKSKTLSSMTSGSRRPATLRKDHNMTVLKTSSRPIHYWKGAATSMTTYP